MFWKVDIVSCNVCLEVPAKSIDDYKRNVKNLNRLVKPGGLVVSLEKLFVRLQPKILNFHEEDVKEVYKMAGFAIASSH